MTQYLKTDWDYNSQRLVELYDELPIWAAPFGLKLLDGIKHTMIEFYSTMEKVLTDLKLDNCLEKMRNQIYNKRKPLDQYLEQIKSHGCRIDSVKHDNFELLIV